VNRFQLFKGHYNNCRTSTEKPDGSLTFIEFILSQKPLGWKHSKSIWNCFWWSLSNSKTHNIDGTYLK